MKKNTFKNKNGKISSGKDAPKLTENQIQGAFQQPIGTPKIRELAKGRKSAAIVLDDISRPTKGEKILDFVIEELELGSIPKNKIKIILALGAHRPMALARGPGDIHWRLT